MSGAEEWDVLTTEEHSMLIESKHREKIALQKALKHLHAMQDPDLPAWAKSRIRDMIVSTFRVLNPENKETFSND